MNGHFTIRTTSPATINSSPSKIKHIIGKLKKIATQLNLDLDININTKHFKNDTFNSNSYNLTSFMSSVTDQLINNTFLSKNNDQISIQKSQIIPNNIEQSTKRVETALKGIEQTINILNSVHSNDLFKTSMFSNYIDTLQNLKKVIENRLTSITLEPVSSDNSTTNDTQLPPYTQLPPLTLLDIELLESNTKAPSYTLTQDEIKDISENIHKIIFQPASRTKEHAEKLFIYVQKLKNTLNIIQSQEKRDPIISLLKLIHSECERAIKHKDSPVDSSTLFQTVKKDSNDTLKKQSILVDNLKIFDFPGISSRDITRVCDFEENNRPSNWNEEHSKLNGRAIDRNKYLSVLSILLENVSNNPKTSLSAKKTALTEQSRLLSKIDPFSTKKELQPKLNKIAKKKLLVFKESLTTNFERFNKQPLSALNIDKFCESLINTPSTDNEVPILAKHIKEVSLKIESFSSVRNSKKIKTSSLKNVQFLQDKHDMLVNKQAPTIDQMYSTNDDKHVFKIRNPLN
jgi:hypothetical protein